MNREVCSHFVPTELPCEKCQTEHQSDVDAMVVRDRAQKGADMDYWGECVAEAMEDAGIVATPEQIETVTAWVEGAHENYGMAHGHDCIPNPLQAENDDLRRQLKAEQDKVLCEDCGGAGWITIRGPLHSGTSQCSRCRGDGRHSL